MIPLDDQNSWVDQLAQLVINVPPPPFQKDDRIEHMGSENFRFAFRINKYNRIRTIITKHHLRKFLQANGL